MTPVPSVLSVRRCLIAPARATPGPHQQDKQIRMARSVSRPVPHGSSYSLNSGSRSGPLASIASTAGVLRFRDEQQEEPVAAGV
jgi:hypothetical protein